MAKPLTCLRLLEAESIQMIREAAAESERPAMLYSIGKDSAVLLHLALKAFAPARPPFPLLHIDTTWTFQDMIAFRERTVRRLGLELHVYVNPDGARAGINPVTCGSALFTDVMKTQALEQALERHAFDVVLGGTRLDEHPAQAGEPRTATADRRRRPDPIEPYRLWHLYNMRPRPGCRSRVFPLAHWTELDVWQYVHAERIPVARLYFAASRAVVRRQDALIVVEDDRLTLEPGEIPEVRTVRFRTLGCYPLTGAIESDASTVPAIIRETFLANDRDTGACGAQRVPSVFPATNRVAG